MSVDASASQAALKALREARKGPLASRQERLKEQTRIEKELVRHLKEGPRTVPELAQAAGLPTQTVFWQLMVLKKYGRVAEGDQDGDYYQYRLVENQ